MVCRENGINIQGGDGSFMWPGRRVAHTLDAQETRGGGDGREQRAD